MIDERPEPDPDSGRRLEREILVGRNRVEGHADTPFREDGTDMPLLIRDGYAIEIYKKNREYFSVSILEYRYYLNKCYFLF